MKKFGISHFLVLAGVSLFPFWVFAQYTPVASISGGLTTVGPALMKIFNILFPILLIIGVFIITLGIFRFIANAGDEDERRIGRMKLMWGVVSIFLMLSVWGLVNILYHTFALDTAVPINSQNFLGGIH